MHVMVYKYSFSNTFEKNIKPIVVTFASEGKNIWIECLQYQSEEKVI